MTTVPATRLMRKRRRPFLPVTSQSVALFRLGEICNNRCPMCSNSGRPDAWKTASDELLARVDRLADMGFKRVVVTGGEPTIHPAFFAVVHKLQARNIAWDINTHGRSFADPDFTERALQAGLERAIVSFHSHQLEASMIISGMPERGHEQTLRGVANLIDAGCDVMLNTVICQDNLDHLVELVTFCADTYAHRAAGALQLKIVFPYLGGKGGSWSSIQLKYADVLPTVRAARKEAKARGVELLFESFPNCLLGEPTAKNLSRTGFGETHYLEDIAGQEVFPMRHIEAELTVFGEQCRECSAVKFCPGISELYARKHGTSELVPFSPKP